MSHPELINSTPYACELLFLTNEVGTPVCVPIVQATFALTDGHSLTLLPQQPTINLGGAWWGEPGMSSIRFEPQIAFLKLATDVVLLGHAYPTNRDRTEGMVGIRVGSDLQKVARVFGNRWFVRRLGVASATAPEPFDRIPLTYEYAFGGADRLSDEKQSFEPRNPVGMGYRGDDQTDHRDIPMPNLEDPRQLYERPPHRPPPAGFGFIAPNWQPRAKFAGTYDQVWNDTRKPLLPSDFDRRFFNSASPGLIAAGHLRGDEWVTVVGASLRGRLDFALPGVGPVACRVVLKGSKAVDLQASLDTLVVDMDQETVTLTWRAHLPVPRGIHDIAALELSEQPHEE
jgi:hypothetical protein